MKRSTGPAAEKHRLAGKCRLPAADRASRSGALSQQPPPRASPPTPGLGERFFAVDETERALSHIWRTHAVTPSPAAIGANWGLRGVKSRPSSAAGLGAWLEEEADARRLRAPTFPPGSTLGRRVMLGLYGMMFSPRPA